MSEVVHRVEVFRMNGKLMIIHPRTKEIVPAPEGAKVGQKVEVSEDEL